MALGAGLDVELPSTDCYGAAAARRRSTSGSSTSDDARRRGAPRAADEVRARPVRAARTSTSTPGRATRRHRRASRARARRSRARASCSCATTASLPLAAGVGVDRRDRPERRRARATCSATTRYPAHVESLREMLASGGERRLDVPIARRRSSSTRSSVEAPIGARRAARAARRTVCASRPAATSNGDDRDGFDEAVALAARVRRRRPGDGRQVGAHRRLHERREPRPRVARPPGRAGGARRAPSSRPGRRSCSCSSPAGRAAASGLHEHCAAVLLAWLPGRGGRGGDRRRRSAATSTPAASCRSRSRARSARSRSSTGTRSPAAARTGRATTSTLPVEPALPVRPRPQLHDVRARRRRASASATVVVERDDHRRRRPSRTPGERAGDEVVQLYVRDPQASVTRPVLELKSFVARRARPRAVERRVTFDVPVGQLGFHGRELDYVVEPGVIDVFVGTLVGRRSSTAGSVTVVADASRDRRRRRSTARSRSSRATSVGASRRRADGDRRRRRRRPASCLEQRDEGLSRAASRRSTTSASRSATGEFMVLVGPVGLRQVDAAADDRRPRGGHGGRGLRSAATTSPTCAPQRPRHRDGLPELRALPAHDRRREPRLRPEAPQGARRPSGERRVEEVARDARPRRAARPQAGAALRAASASASRWAGRWCASRRRSSWTSRSRTSTPSCACRCARELARLHERLGVTTVYVTHDQVEAMTLGQRVAVLRDGVLQQVDTPQTLFRSAGEPVRRRVHRLAVDEPRRGRRRRRRRLRFAGYELPLPDGACGSAERRVIVGIRPTDFAARRAGRPEPAAPARARRRSSRISAPSRTSSSRSMRRASSPRPSRAAEEQTERRRTLLADDQRALFTARVDGQRVRRARDGARARRRPAPAALLRPGDRRSAPERTVTVASPRLRPPPRRTSFPIRARRARDPGSSSSLRTSRSCLADHNGRRDLAIV